MLFKNEKTCFASKNLNPSLQQMSNVSNCGVHVRVTEKEVCEEKSCSPCICQVNGDNDSNEMAKQMVMMAIKECVK